MTPEEFRDVVERCVVAALRPTVELVGNEVRVSLPYGYHGSLSFDPERLATGGSHDENKRAEAESLADILLYRIRKATEEQRERELSRTGGDP